MVQHQEFDEYLDDILDDFDDIPVSKNDSAVDTLPGGHGAEFESVAQGNDKSIDPSGINSREEEEFIKLLSSNMSSMVQNEFQQSVQTTMDRIKKSAATPVESKQDDMFKQFEELMGNEDFEQVFDELMDQIDLKQLIEPMIEVRKKYELYFKDTKNQNESYTDQYNLISKICLQLQSEGFDNDNVLSLINDLQSLGDPPPSCVDTDQEQCKQM